MQLAFAVGGAAVGAWLAPVGFAFMGMSGMQLGWAVGSMAGSLLSSNDVQLPGVSGPRLADLKVQTSTYGNAIPRAFGTVRIAGNLIWAPPITEHATTQTVESGGKGGGSSTSQEQTSFTYTASFAVAICEGPLDGNGIIGIRKVWANGDLVADRGDDSTVLSGFSGILTVLNGVTVPSTDGFFDVMTVYRGTETQTVDPTMAAESGDLTPAYRGRVYVVFTDLQLAKYGNRIPNLEFEVVVSGANDIMVPRLFYTLPGGAVYNSTGELSGELGARRNSPNAQYFWTVLNAGSPLAPKTIALFDNYTASLVFQRVYSANLQLASENGFNGRMWFQEQTTSHLRAISTTGQVWDFGAFGATDVPRVVQVYEFQDPNLTPTLESREETPEIFLHYNDPTPGVQTIYHGNASGLGTLTAVSTARSINEFMDSADQIQGRVYIRCGQFLGALNSRLGYCEVGDVASVFHVIRDYDSTGSPQGMIGRDGYIYARSGMNGFYNVVEKMDRDGNVVDSITLPGISSSNGASTRMVQDGVGFLYVQVDRELFRIHYGTMELDAQATLSNSSDWIMPTDTFEGRGVLVTRQAVGNRDELYVLSDTISSSPPLLSEVNTELIELTGLTSSDADVSDLASDTVSGYVISQRGPVRGMIEPLMGTFFYDAVESDNRIKFVKRGGAVAVTIPEADLAAHTGAPDELPDSLVVTRKQEMELPREINIAYMSKALDYQVSQQLSRRLITQSVQSLSLQVPIVLTDDEAKRIADTHIFSAWVERESHSTETGRDYLAYEPCDVIGLTKNGVVHNVRVIQKDEGADGAVRWKAVADYSSIYDQTSTGAAPLAEPQSTSTVGPTAIEFLDIPLARDEDDDAGFYFAARGNADGWHGVNLYQSTDYGVTYENVGALLPESTMGHATDVLGDYAGNIELIDEGNSVTVVVDSGQTLESITRDELLNGGNASLLGGEPLHFRDATLIATDTYTLTGFLRARRGAETFMSTHVAGERFVLLDANLRTVAQPVSLKDQALYYKPVSVGRSLSATAAQAFVNTARRKKPLSPVHLGAGQNSGGDWIMEWERRTRYEAVWLDSADVPLGESIEQYAVHIMDDDTVVRTITVSTNTATYTAAEQLTDWGFLTTSLTFEVAQVSGETGEGYPATLTVDFGDPYGAMVKLLMHMDGLDGGTNFIDVLGHAVTVAGNAQIDTAQKQFGTASALFDGVNDWIQVAHGGNFDIGTSDFTIEGWMNTNDFASNKAVLGRRPSAAVRSPFFVFQVGPNLTFYSSSDGSAWDIASAQLIGALSSGVWQHFAITRQGNTFRTYLDGVEGSNWTSSLAGWANGEDIYIGNNGAGSEDYVGWLDELRITIGVARYTAPFTPPTAAFTL